MFADRQIADPFVAAQVFTSEPKGEVANHLIRKLKDSQKDMEHRLHPWMNNDTEREIRELESDESRTRRRTIRGDTNLSGSRPMKEEKPSFKRERDFDSIDDAVIDNFDLKAPKNI